MLVAGNSMGTNWKGHYTTSRGLPVGMMLVGRHREDGTVRRAADAFQKLG